MNICLINAPCLGIDDANLEPPLGLLYIAALLREHAFNHINIYTMTDAKTEDEIREKIYNIPQADVYGFTVFCTNYNYVKMCMTHIRLTYPDSVIILGGPNASALPEYTLNDSFADVVIVGEGEDAFVRTVQALEHIDYVPPIVYGEGRKNIDELPFPAWDLVDLHEFNRVLNGERVISILTSRGCPNNCTHCNSIVMGAGNKIRYRSTQNIIDEIKYLQSLGYSNFRFNDDNFVCRPNIKELTDELKKLNIKYRAFAHIKDLTDEVCHILAESGCQHIAIGLESMNPDNLKFLRKNTNVEIVDKNLQNVRRYGMIARCYFIVGLIHDNYETIEKYTTIASLLPFDEWTCYPLIPYPGTAIWKTPEKFGYSIVDKDFTQYYQIGENKKTCFMLDHTNFSHYDVELWVNYVNKKFEERGKVHTGKSVTK